MVGVSMALRTKAARYLKPSAISPCLYIYMLSSQDGDQRPMIDLYADAIGARQFKLRALVYMLINNAYIQDGLLRSKLMTRTNSKHSFTRGSLSEFGRLQ